MNFANDLAFDDYCLTEPDPELAKQRYLSRASLNQIDFIDEVSDGCIVVGVCAHFVREPADNAEIGAGYGWGFWAQVRRTRSARMLQRKA